MGKVKRTLSILLSVAMVVTCVPQTGLSALAANETPGITEAAGTEAAEVKVETPESNSEVTDDAEAEDVADEEDSTEVIGEGGEEQTPADDEQAQEPVANDEAAEDGESEDVAKDLTAVDAGADAVEVADGTGFTYTAGTVNGETGAYEFTVAAETGYTISKVEYKYTKAEGDSEVTETATGSDGTYSIPAEVFTAMKEGSKVKITVTADINKYTVTITGLGANVTVKSGIGAAATPETAVSGNITDVEHGSVLKLFVEPATGYVETVKVDGEALSTAADHIYTVTVDKNITVGIEVERTSYVITKSVVAATDSDLAADDIKDVDVTFDTTLADPPTGAAEGVVGTIAKDTDLTFSVTGLAANQRADVYYGDSSAQTTPVSAKDGKYTITGAQIKALGEDITIKVEVRGLIKSTITVDGDDNVTAVKQVADETETAIPTDGVKVDEDSTFSFKVETAKFFKVKTITVSSGAKVETTGEGKDAVYSFKVTNAASTVIYVTTELDEEQCYKLALNINGDQGSATVALALPTDVNDEDIPSMSDDLVEEKDLVTRNPIVRVTVTPDAKYELAAEKGVDIETLEGAKIEPVEDENNKVVAYDITLVEGKTVTLNVTTEVRGIDDDATVTFDNKAAKMTLNVPEQDGVTKAADKDEYTLVKGTKRLKFEITADGPYKPTVKDEVDNDYEEYCEYKDGVYNYDVPAFKFNTEAILTITETEIKNTLTFDGDTGNVDVIVSVNGKALSAPYSVLQGTTVDIKVTQKDNCTLNTVTYGAEGTENTAKVNKGIAEFTVKNVKEDIKVKVGAKAEYKAAPLKDAKDNDKVLEPVKGVYSVSYTGKYTVGLMKGASGELEDVAAIQVLDGKNDLTDKVTIDTTNKKAPSIELSEDVASKKLTVKLFVAGADDDAGPVDSEVSYTLQVTKVVSKITAPGKATQPTDTTKEYKVTTDGEIAKLAITVTGDAGVISGNPEFNENGMLEITTGQTVGKANVVISGGDDKSATIEVTTTALISSATAKPTVALKSASDVSLTLTLGAKKIDTPANGAVYYKVVVTPQAETETKRPTGLKAAVDTVYVKKDGDSQSERIVVGAEDRLGSGGAWKYDVTVSLVHVKAQGETINDATIASQIVTIGDAKAESQPFTTGTKPFATLTPAWESNLKLKGASPIYTGQTGAKIATLQFSKTTTYTEIDTSNIRDISWPAGGNALTGFRVENGEIIVSATKNTAVGKHTIEVIAGANEKALEGGGKTNSMYASRATVVVTVERGINTLGVSVPSESLYKAAGKAATLKPTAIFNGDSTGKDKTKQPKAKTVKWELVTGDSTKENETEFADPKVSINAKNGTVTVAKDYILKANDVENTFKIKVSVDNGTDAKPKWIGAADPEYSAPIKITNEGAQIKTVAIVALGGAKATVIATPTKNDKGKIVPTLKNAKELENVQVYAFTTDAPANEYSWDDLKKVTVPDTNLTFKSSKAKNVEVNSWGGLKVNSPAKGVKLTVTANDGSNSKGELTLDVDYDTPLSDNLALDIYKMKLDANNTDLDKTYVDWGSNVYSSNHDAIADKDKGAISVKYDGAAVSRLALQVCNLNPASGDNWYKPASKHANFTVKVKSGGKITGEDEGWDNGTNYKVYYVTLDKRDAVIELTYPAADGKTKKTRTYTLTNNDILGTSATTMKITAKAMNTLRPVGTKAEQEVTIQLGKVDLTGYDDCTVTADVEVDWSKMNDKNADALRYFAANLSKSSYELEDYDSTKKTANITLSFNDTNPRFDLSSYALKVTLRETHEVTDESDAKKTDTNACSASAAVTVKVDKVKKFTFKPTTSYTIGAKDGYAVLGGKSSIPADELNLEFTDLLNLADKTGQENHFADTFDIVNGKLKVEAGDKAADYLKDKANLTGYLEYTATTDKQYYDNKGAAKQLVKITVKVNPNAAVKYTHDSASIGNKTDSKAEVQIKVDSKDAIDTAWSGTGNKAVTVVAARLKKDSDQIKVEVKDGKLLVTMLKDADANKLKKITADIYIVPQDSDHTVKFVDGDGKAKDDVTEQTYKDYAATVKVTLNVIASPEEPLIDTVDVAKDEVNKWIKSIQAAEAPTWLTETTDATTAKAAVEKELKDAVKAADSITIAVLDEDFTYEAASTAKEGSVSGKIKVSNGTEADDKILEFNFTIPKLPAQEPEQVNIEDTLVDAIKKAVKDEAEKTDGGTIKIQETTTWNDISVATLAVANAVDGVSANFEVVAADADPLKIAEVDGSKKATINLVVRQKNKTSNSKPVVIENIELATE